MADMNIRSVRFSVAVDERFEKVARKLGRTKRLLFVQMVEYFYRSKKDPADLGDELLKNSLLKNHQHYISFIRAQENMLLLPIKAEVDKVSRSQREIVGLFNNEIIRQNQLVLQSQQAQNAAIVALDKAIAEISRRLADKETLKYQALVLVGEYISAREALGIRASSKEKTELALKLREKIRLL